MMLYKLLLNKIDGKLYNSVKSIYQSSESCVRINGKLTSWFCCKTGVKQGDNLSPTLFSIFINDLVQEINDLNLGVDLLETKLSLLLYADDIALVAKSAEDLQCMLNTLHQWCKRWRVLINTDKSKCIHFRKPRTKETNFEFTIGKNKLEKVKMAKSKSQRMKEYRERKKASLGEKWLIQESNRTREYYKPTSQLNSKEKKARRERIRDNVSAYRKRQITLLNKTNNVALLNEADLDEPNPVVLIADENGVSSTSTNQPLIVKMPLISAKSKGGKKRASHALKRATNEIRNLKTHNKNLKKSQNTLRKRLEREKKRNSEKKNTPRSKTDALIQRAGLTPGTRNTENIRKKLLYAECV
ncbi:Hypothetical predicted protein [Mytilus galloprovincialis]|uniref:Reverse transcriptase domain-containing protein n=1 Tax=Mytilus galloprovincialis TaxID=29158 RepID=A0A8B6G8R9_MYTGA|nr:Hypothetical predicted protein [Mytilus galloprovincialis]